MSSTTWLRRSMAGVLVLGLFVGLGLGLDYLADWLPHHGHQPIGHRLDQVFTVTEWADHLYAIGALLGLGSIGWRVHHGRLPQPGRHEQIPRSDRVGSCSNSSPF